MNEVSVDSFPGNGSLYKVRPLVKTAIPILIGMIEGQPEEPVAWTHTYQTGRIFYTSLGHPQDFNDAQFVRMLTNAVFWAIHAPVPDPTSGAISVSD